MIEYVPQFSEPDQRRRQALANVLRGQPAAPTTSPFSSSGGGGGFQPQPAAGAANLVAGAANGYFEGVGEMNDWETKRNEFAAAGLTPEQTDQLAGPKPWRFGDDASAPNAPFIAKIFGGGWGGEQT
jgi:hypothetical protein